LGFQFLKQERKEIANKAKYFWIFSNIKPKLATEKANKEKQRKHFWSFCVLECRNKNENNKESEAWIYKVPTKYDM
jgi:hypothetical protein